jgi:spore coat polysaccharide biosynthesis predicted glycosyltransferase SpsG
MTVATSFSKQELLDLISKSDAIKMLSQDQLIRLIKKTNDPLSSAAKNLFEALQFEVGSYQKIRQNYLQKTAELYQQFPGQLAQTKQVELREQLKTAEEKSAEVEQETVQNLLNNL